MWGQPSDMRKKGRKQREDKRKTKNRRDNKDIVCVCVCVCAHTNCLLFIFGIIIVRSFLYTWTL